MHDHRRCRGRAVGGLIAVLLLCASASGSDAIDRFVKAEWVLVAELADVSPVVLAALQSRLGSDQPMAARGEPFEATDVVSGEMPSRRFVLAGRNGTDWFVAYEQGGYSHHLVLATFTVGETDAEVTLLARDQVGTHDDSALGWRVTLDELRDALSEGSLAP